MQKWGAWHVHHVQHFRMGATPPRAAARHMRSVSPRHSDPHSVSGMHALFLCAVHTKAPLLGRALLPPICRGIWVSAVSKRMPKPRAGQAVRVSAVYGHARVLAHTQPGRVAAVERRRGRGNRRGSYAKGGPGITEVPALPCRVLALIRRHATPTLNEIKSGHPRTPTPEVAILWRRARKISGIWSTRAKVTNGPWA